jgi:D-alanine-D-alanine ligase
MVKVDSEWWTRIFDEIYLVTDARSVCDHELTCQEVNFLEHALSLDKSSPILDLCGGQGRHSLELSRRGYKDVTVLDYSEFLIDLGKERAKEEKLETLFIRGDARDTGLPAQKYRAVIIMASSFGYFLNEEENEKVLHESFRILIPGGILLLDLPNLEYIRCNFQPRSWHEADEDIVVCRQRRLEKDILYCREVVVSKRKGLMRDEGYSTRLYSKERISGMLKNTGFHWIDVRKDFVSHERHDDYGCMTNRMIVTAGKGP